MKILFYDFEVFAKFWMVVAIEYETRKKHIILQDVDKLRQLYTENSDSIWVGYNSRQYDQFVLKGLLLGYDPYYVTNEIIGNDVKGHQVVKEHDSIHLNNFDVSTGFHGLKQLEGFMGSTIKESDVDFFLKRELTDDEKSEVTKYCIHDVEQTIEVFENRKEEFDSQLSLIDAFNLEPEMFNKTKAQLSAHILGANSKKEYNDEFELIFPDTLVLEKYKHVLEWYKDSQNMDYKKSLVTDVANVQHIFAWGGIHGAISGYNGEGLFIMSDIASMYPALMIEYNLLSRNVENPSKFKEIRDERIILKRNKDPRQLPYKIVLNSTYGASKDQYNNLYDPRMANSVCISGQLLLLDLIEKVEPYCELIQSNTDGILVKVSDEDAKRKYLELCDEWSKRTRLDLEHDEYVKVIQKDVNNYIIIDKNGKYKSKGGYVKKLNKIDNDLPIVNKALINYFVNGTSVEDTINNENQLINFQKIVKVSRLYSHAIHNGVQLKEKVFRVFASTDESDSEIIKVKPPEKHEKIANTPEHCFIINDDVNDKLIPEKLDRRYYIELAEKRLGDFLKSKSKEVVQKSEITGINVLLKDEVDQLLKQDLELYELLKKLKTETSLSVKQVETLIKIGYFDSIYKNSKKLIYSYTILNKFLNRKKLSESDINDFDIPKYLIALHTSTTGKSYKINNTDEFLSDWINWLEFDSDFCLTQKLGWQVEYLGKMTMVDESYDVRNCVVMDLDTKYTPKFNAYCIAKGTTGTLKVRKKPRWKETDVDSFDKKPFKNGDILYVHKFSKEPVRKKIDDEWVDTGEFEFWAIKYDVVERS